MSCEVLTKRFIDNENENGKGLELIKVKWEKNEWKVLVERDGGHKGNYRSKTFFLNNRISWTRTCKLCFFKHQSCC